MASLLSGVSWLSPGSVIGGVLQNVALNANDASKGLAAVSGTFGNLITNLSTGRLLTPSASVSTGIQTVDKVLTLATSPVGIAATAAIGAGVATAAKAIIGGQPVSAAAKTAAGAGATGAGAAAGSKAINNPPTSDSSIPKTTTGTAGTPSPNASDGLPTDGSKVTGKATPTTGLPSADTLPKTTAQTPDLVKAAEQKILNGGGVPDAASGLKTLQTTLNPTDGTTSTPNSTTSTPKKTSAKKKSAPQRVKAVTTKKRTTPKAKSSKARKTTTKKKSSKKGRTAKYKAPSRYGSGKQYAKKGGKEVYYTKTGQPYILMASGKAKFIKR